jgi:hypothetical protein
MQTKVILACSLAAFVAVAGGTAEATGLIHTGNIAKGAVTLDRLAPKVQKLVTAMPKNGTNGLNGVDGIPGAPGAKGATGATGDTGPMGEMGPAGADGAAAAKGDAGLNGLDGVAGPKGDTGLTGAKGDMGLTGPKGDTGNTGPKGEKGDTGNTGPKGDDGKDGKDGTNGVDAPARQYGAASILVSRNGSPASTWATYSTALGSPYGDTTGGTFRFTCSGTVNCTIGVKASVTAGASHGLYPRLLVYKSGPTGDAGSISECEYADGGVTSISLPNTDVTLNIGGSADCLASPVLPIGNGDVSTIVVPAGNYYDVLSSFTFLP